MKTALLLMLAVFVCFFGTLAIAGVICYSTVKSEVDLRTQFEAQEKSVAVSYDTTWKILQTKAGIVDKYKNDFKAIWPEIISGRYNQGSGQMMQWIQERNPNFDSSLYKDLMASVESERHRFETNQNKLIDIHREHTALVRGPLTKFILSLFGSNKELGINIITSTQTQSVIESGKDDDVDLFKNPTP